jgi:hypothetical protein
MANVVSFLIILPFLLTACNQGATMKPDFDKAVQAHLDSIPIEILTPSRQI